MKFNKSKCKALHMCWDNPKHKYRLSREWIKSSPEEKDLRVLDDKKVNTVHCQQCALATLKASFVLGGIRRSMASRLRALCLEYCIQVWGPQHKMDVDRIEQVQKRAMKLIRVLEHLSYEDWLREFWLFSLEEIGLWRQHIAPFQYLKGGYKRAGEGLFTRTWSDRTRDNSFKLRESSFRLDIRKKFFTVMVVSG
ncbi:hypothetical protein WISP_50149 [Willisornis vidua]|uniref:Uncharacterized protein n=1 Tax=Willisornis vidua TaxID=1566151 RepID=A0ABQ9DIE5_9PASS|nr:hypothetical protein WISP_50149 [Willisornis vidua]